MTTFRPPKNFFFAKSQADKLSSGLGLKIRKGGAPRDPDKTLLLREHSNDAHGEP